MEEQPGAAGGSLGTGSNKWNLSAGAMGGPAGKYDMLRADTRRSDFHPGPPRYGAPRCGGQGVQPPNGITRAGPGVFLEEALGSRGAFSTTVFAQSFSPSRAAPAWVGMAVLKGEPTEDPQAGDWIPNTLRWVRLRGAGQSLRNSRS
ncbi:unnamed protein product [Arctogadus glacialis]